METETLSRREATLRSAATASLAGIALVQAIGLPSLFVQGRQLAVLSMAAMALCVGLGLALAAAPAGAAPQLWRAVAATAVLVLAGWAAPRMFAVPGMTGQRGQWTTMPGAACGVLAALSVLVAVAAARPTRAAARGLATAAALLVAMGPGVGAVLVALGPGPAGGETALAAPAHLHSHLTNPAFENSIEFRAGSGRQGGRFVVPVATPPRQTALGLPLVVSAALVFTYGALTTLRRRSAPPAPTALSGVQSGLA